MSEAVEASYWSLHPERVVARTVTVNDAVLADVDDDGRIIGVEQIGGPVTMDTLAQVLRTVEL